MINLNKLRLCDVTVEKEYMYRCISRDKLNSEEIKVLREFHKILFDKMDRDQRHVYESIIESINDDKLNKFDTTKPPQNVVKTKTAILNAPAATGKSYVTLAMTIKIILDYGYKNGAIILVPSYASFDAIINKIRECYEDIEDIEDIELKVKKIRFCLNIKTTNSFYACGSQAFNIHDPTVSSEVIKRFRRFNQKKTINNWKKNNIQAIRETRAIFLDEAFFSTANRCRGFFDMLMDGYINHPFKNKEISKQYPYLLERLIFKKKIIFVGDPYQLSVCVEEKEPGVEKYLQQSGDPLWFFKNKLRDHITLKDDMLNYDIYTLIKNYRFDESVPNDLKKAIESIRKVVYKDEEGHEEYKQKMKNLIKIMDKEGMIKYNTRIEDVVKEIEESRKPLYVVTEIHKVRNKINHIIDSNKKKGGCTKYIIINTEFLYGIKDGDTMEWNDYMCYINKKQKQKKLNKTEKDIFINNFKRRYELECKNGCVAHKFIGKRYPSQEKEKDYYTNELFVGDIVRITYPLSKKHRVERITDKNTYINLPNDFKLSTGTFGKIVGFNNDDVLFMLINKDDIKNYNSNYGEFKVINPATDKPTINPIFSIKHSKKLGDPYFKSSFCDYIISEKSFNLGIHSYPFTKESSSTIHSLQGKTEGYEKKIVYYMASFRKADLNNAIDNKVANWKGSLPNLLYVAVTRSKFPHINFKLMTHAKNQSMLIKQLTSGKRPKSYRYLKEFDGKIEELANKKL